MCIYHHFAFATSSHSVEDHCIAHGEEEDKAAETTANERADDERYVQHDTLVGEDCCKEVDMNLCAAHTRYRPKRARER